FGFGAGVSWCCRTNLDMSIEKTIGLFAFDDPSFNAGYLAYELGDVSTATGIYTSNASPLFIALRESLTAPDIVLWIRSQGVERAIQQIEKAMTHMKKMKIKNNERILIQDEFENAARLLKHACSKTKMILDYHTKGIKPSRNQLKKLVADAKEIIDEHKRLWLKRNRPGGLEESVQLLEKFTISEYQNQVMK
ncbi:MAG: hypothetical protein NC906_09335, partial [Candidatus Omnitrophica bacterium]|nr:hypothetical protein [Candidatus Omnitrophota bacterium]